MGDILATIGAIIAFICPFLFLVGLMILLVSAQKRQIGIKLIIISIIGFIIGFGTCLANLSLGGMH